MLNRKDLQPGTIVWWGGQTFSCPAVIAYVEEKHFGVKTLDTFKKCDMLIIDDYCEGGRVVEKTERRTMRLASIDEVMKFFTEEIERRSSLIVKNALESVKASEEELAIFTKKALIFISEQALKK